MQALASASASASVGGWVDIHVVLYPKKISTITQMYANYGATSTFPFEHRSEI